MGKRLYFKLIPYAMLVALLLAPAAHATNNDGRGLYGATDDKVVTNWGLALIIFFPGIVSSGLDKEEKVDLDQVQMQMEAATRGAEVPDELPAAGASAPSGADDKAADEDPMKAMMDSMDKDAKKK